MSLFEPEEFIGTRWHRLVGGLTTLPHHPQAAIRLADIRGRLGVLFRALGGDGAIRLAEAAAAPSPHRLGFMQRIGLGQEKLERAVLDNSSLRLPAIIDYFPNAADNAALYEWLVAWFAHARPVASADDALARDILALRAAVAGTRAALQAWPGLRPLFHRLRAATLAARPERRLPGVEAQLETAIRAILGGRRPTDNGFLALIEEPGADISTLSAPRGYRPFLPIPLFGELRQMPGAAPPDEREEEAGSAVTADQRRRQAERRETDQSDRGDPLCFHRFETIFSLAEMVNVNRRVDEDDEEGARQAADDLTDLTIGSNRQRTAARLKLDLDLAPSAVEETALTQGLTYPEWDWKKQAHRPNHCRIIAARAREDGEVWHPSPEMQRQIRAVRRQFEALRPRRVVLQGQPDGEELDLSALVRAAADRKAGGPGSENLFIAGRAIERDLSMAVLMDVSLSTDAAIGDLRVIDVEKAALLALSQGLDACGDEHAIFTFTSRRRRDVRVDLVKDFTDPMDARVVRRIEGLKPGQYTRMGAAVRHVTAQLAQRPQRHRLLLLLTDGKPNDIDYYEGRYGIEDTRAAIREARKQGLKVFGVTVDEAAQDYFPYLFGRGAYAIITHPERLPAALPAIYRQLVG
ncbi:nitric oxide reductase activation protein NorD [Niveispirillum irakense]|uniref:nitric oxide reductase activation protein NorD n=1 Tax=Niveispirillum irakense TaxID=34011 RepID=UPI000406C0D7|nr:VWA domain-containing protein [Niveispirillum irakense]